MAELTIDSRQDPRAFLELLNSKIKGLEDELSGIQESKEALQRQIAEATAAAELGLKKYPEAKKQSDWTKVSAMDTEILQKETLLEQFMGYLPAAKEAVHMAAAGAALEVVQEKREVFVRGIAELLEQAERFAQSADALTELMKDYSGAVSEWGKHAVKLGQVIPGEDAFSRLPSGLGRPLDTQTTLYLKNIVHDLTGNLIRRYSRFRNQAGGPQA